MRLNRREFIASTAAAVTTLKAAPVSARQGRQLSIVYHGLSIVVIGRSAAAASGVPASAPRVDVVFVKNAAHDNPLLFGSGISPLSLANADLRILVAGKPLGGGTVSINRSPATTCPANSLEWANVNRIPEFDSILNKTVTIKKTALQATNPVGVSGRVSMRSGQLFGEIPVQAYDGAQWSFPTGNAAYVRAFTDTLLWSVEIPAGDVTFEAVKFDGTASPKPVVVSTAGDVQMLVEAQRIDRVPPSSPETQIAHFVHYYDLLDYSGKTATSPKPIPTRASAACSFVRLTDAAQQRRFQTSFELRSKFLKRDDEDDCGGSSMRAEPGICLSGIAYSDFQ